MTNQRTGVPVIGSSASDDSQSQPPNTPPHFALSHMNATTVPSAASKVAAKSSPSTMSFSMDTILENAIRKHVKEADSNEISSEKYGSETQKDACETASEDDSFSVTLEILDDAISLAVAKVEKQKTDMSCEIVEDVVNKVIDLSEEKVQKQPEKQAEIHENEADSASGQPIEDAEITDATRDNTQTAAKESEDVREKNEDSENLAKALLEELKVLSGVSDAPSLDIVKKEQEESQLEQEAPKEEQDAPNSSNEEHRENPTKDDSEKTETAVAEKDDTGSCDEQTQENETKTNEDAVQVERLSDGAELTQNEDKEKTGSETKPTEGLVEIKAEQENGNDGSSQDSAQDELERLTSELMFLNKSASESVHDANVEMEWEETLEKKEKFPDVNKENIDEEKGVGEKLGSDETQPKETDAKQMEIKVETADKPMDTEIRVEKDIKKENDENAPDEKTAREKGQTDMFGKTDALSAIGMDYASSVTSESDTEERVTSSVLSRKSPMARIAELDEREERGEDKRERSKAEDVKTEKDDAEHESQVDAETGEVQVTKESGKNTNETTSVAVEKGSESSLKETERKDKTEEEEGVTKQDELIKDPSTVQKVDAKELIDLCLQGFALCLKRFPQHFKAMYQLAFIYYNSKDHRVSLYLFDEQSVLFRSGTNKTEQIPVVVVVFFGGNLSGSDVG